MDSESGLSQKRTIRSKTFMLLGRSFTFLLSKPTFFYSEKVDVSIYESRRSKKRKWIVTKVEGPLKTIQAFEPFIFISTEAFRFGVDLFRSPSTMCCFGPSSLDFFTHLLPLEVRPSTFSKTVKLWSYFCRTDCLIYGWIRSRWKWTFQLSVSG